MTAIQGMTVDRNARGNAARLDQTVKAGRSRDRAKIIPDAARTFGTGARRAKKRDEHAIELQAVRGPGVDPGIEGQWQSLGGVDGDNDHIGAHGSGGGSGEHSGLSEIVQPPPGGADWLLPGEVDGAIKCFFGPFAGRIIFINHGNVQDCLCVGANSHKLIEAGHGPGGVRCCGRALAIGCVRSAVAI